jgi:cytochrome c peroxidase
MAMRQRNLRSALVLLTLVVSLGVLIVLTGACQKASKPVADLTPYPLEIPLGLDKNYAKWIPADNPLTAAKVELGKKLYFDPRLSVDGSISCASCHKPEHGFADEARFSDGVQGQLGDRNSPTVLNRLYSKAQFWDGRAASLEEQALGPVQNPAEMASSLPLMVSGLSKIAAYKPDFQKAFGSEEITAERVGKAIASFERTLLSGNSAFDRFQAGDTSALSESAQRGFAVFMSKGNCAQCHPLPNFTDEGYHNLGVGVNKPNPDLGRFKVTKNEKDRGAFKTPTLRDVANTEPYLHDGSEETIEAVVALVSRGGVRNPNLDPKMKPLRLTKAEQADLVEFLKSLTGEPLNITEPVLPK